MLFLPNIDLERGTRIEPVPHPGLGSALPAKLSPLLVLGAAHTVLFIGQRSYKGRTAPVGHIPLQYDGSTARVPTADGATARNASPGTLFRAGAADGRSAMGRLRSSHC